MFTRRRRMHWLRRGQVARGYSRRQRGRGTGPGWASAYYRPSANRKANAALRLIRKIKGEEEVKEINHTDLITAPIGTTWSPFVPVNLLAQGDTSNTRDGNKVTLQSLSARYILNLNAAETTNSFSRVVVILDRRPNRVLATAAEVFTTDNIISTMNSEDSRYRGRFQIVYDRLHKFPGTTAAAERNVAQIGKIFLNKPTKVFYNAAGGLIANCDKNIFLYGMCNSNSSHAVTMDVNTKIKFTDT